MSTTLAPAKSPAETGESVYNRVFWLAFIANVALVTANALTFRFAEFVKYLGGTEQITGSVVSTGVMGALIARLVLGQAIDRYGTRKLWLLSTGLFVLGCSLFLVARQLSGEIYVGRILFSTGLAGMFTCSIVHIQNLVPTHRRTEVIGSLGSSGFVGMIAGAQLGDWMFRSLPPDGSQFLALFGSACGLGLFYLAVVLYLTRGTVHDRPHETPAAHRLIFRYWPGPVVLVAIMMGTGFTVTTVFLTRFATHLNLVGIGTFFTGYALSAFIIRVSTRHWSRTVGRHKMILMGLVGHCVGLCALPFVTQEWHFLLPSVASGFGHALLFPAVISLGSGAFPREYRGTGTTIVLGFTEVGAMLSAPVLGWLIDNHGFPPMFYAAGVMSLAIAVYYGLTAVGVHDEELAHTGHAVSPEIGKELANEEAEEETVAVPFPQLGRSA